MYDSVYQYRTQQQEKEKKNIRQNHKGKEAEKYIPKKNPAYIRFSFHLASDQIKLRKGKIITAIRTGLLDKIEELVICHAVVNIWTEDKPIPAFTVRPIIFLVIIVTSRAKHPVSVL